MVKNSKTSLQREIANLKKKKLKKLKERKQLLARQKEMNEIKELKREVEFLKGVGTKRRVAKEVGMRIGKQVGHFGWKGLKFAGKLVKARIAAEVREQERERMMSRQNKRPRVLAKVKTRTKAKKRPKTKNKRRVNKRK